MLDKELKGCFPCCLLVFLWSGYSLLCLHISVLVWECLFYAIVCWNYKVRLLFYRPPQLRDFFPESHETGLWIFKLLDYGDF